MISAYFDRLEEDRAVLLVGDDMQKAVFPAKELPPEVSPGDYLCFNITRDDSKTDAALDEALSLLDDD